MSSKWSDPDSEEPVDEGVDGSDHPKGSKVAQRKNKDKANNTVVELMTRHCKELHNQY